MRDEEEGEAELAQVIVAPGARGRGIGRRLVRGPALLSRGRIPAGRPCSGRGVERPATSQLRMAPARGRKGVSQVPPVSPVGSLCETVEKE
ncbi:GNAT family N-acetyltransferase [Streptomyces sp. NPDC051218]|uniref:GNAT family N-acetyltransferase n=1 Tax=Streptomyces sp. NPDC051218 TaxID=3365645 RepID=UPI003797489B